VRSIKNDDCGQGLYRHSSRLASTTAQSVHLLAGRLSSRSSGSARAEGVLSMRQPTTRLINRRTLIKHFGVSGSLLAASCGSSFRAFAQNPDSRTFGIDVSVWGGNIDWHLVVSKLNPRFVFVQAYHMGKDEASSYANPRFANYRRSLQSLGLLHGAYLRCNPNANAETLIKRFWTVYAPQVGDILPTLDIEDDYDNRCSLPVPKRINQIERMVRLVSARINGHKPMIYTKVRVWSELGNPAQFADCPLWLVDYHSTGEPTLPPTWSRFSFWQYAENLHGNGVPGTYDCDYFNGTEESLRAYLLQK
jgi:lysozyme